MGWTILTPLLTLAVYTFVFSVVFQSRWGVENGGHLTVAVNIFVGLITFGLFGDSVNNAPSLVIRRPNFVNKIVFPLQILSVVSVSVAAFHALTSLVILICFQLIFNHWISPNLFWLPLVWLPLVLGSFALSWILSALGVFLRDLSQITSVMTSLMMFLSAIFYPLSSLPTTIQPWLQLNPIALAVEQTRRVVVQGSPPSMSYIVAGVILTTIACELALRFFQRSRRVFADVL
jgi:lipopolysaccharide transport system permease protein